MTRVIEEVDGTLSLNSTNKPLLSFQTFIGPKEKILNVGNISVAVHSDVAGIKGGLSMEFSTDGLNWDHKKVFTFTGKPKTFSVQPLAQWFRLVYINGFKPQTVFRLQTSFRSVFVNPINPMTNLMLDIPKGLLPGVGSISKFGRNPDLDTGSTPEDIWSRGGLWVPPTLPRIHDIVSTSANDIGIIRSAGVATGGSETTIENSGANFVTDLVAIGDVVLNDTTMEEGIVMAVTPTILTVMTDEDSGFRAGENYRVVNASSTGMSVLHLFGLDANMIEQDEFIVMNGLTPVPTTKIYYRVHRMHTDGAANRTISNVGTITATAQVDITVTAQINPSEGQTLMAIYTVPADKTAYMTAFYATINRSGATAGAMADIKLMQTPFANVDGTGSRVRHYAGLSVVGSSHLHHNYKPFLKFNGNTDIWLRCESVTDNNTDISGGFDLILEDK